MNFPLDGDYKIAARYQDKMWYGTHLGVDWLCPTGTPIKAVSNGRIYNTWGPQGGTQTKQVVEDGKYVIRYMHLSKTLLPTNHPVNEGDIIALSGNSGMLTTAPHLHIDMRKDGRWVDPLKVLKKFNILDMDYDELKQKLLKDGYLVRDPRLKQYKKNGAVYIVNNDKRVVYQVKEEEGALPLSFMVDGWMTDEELNYRIVKDKKEVL